MADEKKFVTTESHLAAEEGGPTHQGPGPDGTWGLTGGGTHAIPGENAPDVEGHPKGQARSDYDADEAGGMFRTPVLDDDEA